MAAIPRIGAGDFTRIADDLDIWDAWPIQEVGGAPAVLEGGGTLWMALAAPHFDDPDERHGQARIHLFHHDGASWRPLGPAMPDGFSPGSREWSGSAVLEADARTVTLYFTAAGRRGESTPTFEQRLFSARATLDGVAGDYRLSDWRDLREIVERDPAFYMASDGGTGKIGTIKAFRDPAFFRDPADGRDYLFFAGSRVDAGSDFNGVVGLIVAAPSAGGAGEWRLLPPLIDATGVNNELERPHVVMRDGLYYLFWSTQRHVFDPALGTAPTGLYGMVGEGIGGPWQPLNGTGLVLANPEDAPRQAYSWLVLPDLSVISFVDDWRDDGDDPAVRRFGATFAPTLRLKLSGDQAGLED